VWRPAASSDGAEAAKDGAPPAALGSAPAPMPKEASEATPASAVEAGAQQPPPGSAPPPDQPRGTTEEQAEYQIQLTPPGPERLFRLESEVAFQERMRQEARQRPTLERITFPDEPVLSTEPYVARSFPPAQEYVEPLFVCYNRLYFEDPNTERYGWDMGFIQPVVSTGEFLWDLVALPYHLGTEPCRKFECSAGYCLPGDPVPFLLYPPEFSAIGLTLEAGTIGALFAIFPG
jgi:hypothetical protein